MRSVVVPALLALTGATVAVASRAADGVTPRPAPDNPVVLGYYASWNERLKPENIRYSRFTHLAHAFVKIDREQGQVIQEEAIPSSDLTREAHMAGVKLLLSVGGADSGRQYFNEKGADPSWRKSLVKSLVEAVILANYDGIDVDWEFPTDEAHPERSAVNTANMNLFVAELDAKLRSSAPDALLTMAIPAGQYSGKWFRPEALAPHVNFVNVMTYDFHGPWSRHSGHNAALLAVPGDAVDGSVTNCAAGIAYAADTLHWPRAKLALGIPSYGRQFPTKGLHQPFARDAKCGDLSYTEVAAQLASGWQAHWDEAGKVPWMDHPDMEQVASYEDPRSAEAKGKWASEQKLGGIFFWEISQDFVDGDHALVTAARKGFGLDR